MITAFKFCTRQRPKIVFIVNENKEQKAHQYHSSPHLLMGVRSFLEGRAYVVYFWLWGGCFALLVCAHASFSFCSFCWWSWSFSFLVQLCVETENLLKLGKVIFTAVTASRNTTDWEQGFCREREVCICLNISNCKVRYWIYHFYVDKTATVRHSKSFSCFLSTSSQVHAVLFCDYIVLFFILSFFFL